MSDGTANGTVLVKDIHPGHVSSIPTSNSIFKANGHLFFRANDGIHGNELWKTDGTTLGTRLCKDIFTGKGSSDPGYCTENNGSLYLKAWDGVTVVNCGNSILVNFNKIKLSLDIREIDS